MSAIVFYRVRAVTCTRRIFKTLVSSPFLRRFLLHSFAQLDVTTWSFIPLFLPFLSLFLQRKLTLPEILQILGSDIFFCVEELRIYRPRTRVDDTRECNKDKYLLERESGAEW